MDFRNANSLIRDVLVREPLDEHDIKVGDYILFAQAQPIGLIDAALLDIAVTYDGKLKNNARAFRGVLPDNSLGHYGLILDNRLMITEMRADRDRAIYKWDLIDKDKTTAKYIDSVLEMQWKETYFDDPADMTPTKIVRPEATLYTAKGNLHKRPFGAGTSLVIDDNTLAHIDGAEYFWAIMQYIPGGPKGQFSLPGYWRMSRQEYNLFAEIDLNRNKDVLN